MASRITLLAITAVILATSGQARPSSSWSALRPWWKTARSAGRIVGGYEVDIADVPFQVSLNHGYGHFCGGSVISSNWVLSAGHCAQSDDNSATLQVRVQSTRHAEGGQLVRVKRVVRHPLYDHEAVDYDFALLQLAEELVLDEDFYAVELPEQDEPVEDGSCLQVSGWGYTQNALESRDVLRATNVPAVNQEKCEDQYAFVGEITPRMLCAGFDKGGKDACQGDSGGPLVEGGNKLVGVVSWGKGCAEEGYSGVYSRVASVRDWIKETSGV